MKLLEEAGVELAGARAVVRGALEHRGQADGAAADRADATVTVCHSKTRDLAGGRARARTSWWRRSAGAELIRGDWIKPGAAVIDVGTNRLRGRQAGRRRRVRRGGRARRAPSRRSRAAWGR